MLVIAGTIEGFFSPSAAPAGLKFAVGAMLFTLLLLWLFSSQTIPEDGTTLATYAHSLSQTSARR
jgi:hypothetical protein